MKKSIFAKNFERLEKVIPSIGTINETLKLKSSGFMDLSIEVLERFKNDYLGVYQVVYPEPGKVVPKYKTEQNEFLGQWLDNLAEQGFKRDMFSELESAEGAA